MFVESLLEEYSYLSQQEPSAKVPSIQKGKTAILD